MTLTIDLPPDSERQLHERAKISGVTPAQVAVALIRDGLGLLAKPIGPPNPNDSTLDMLARWAAEDAAEGPADPVEARREWDEFRTAMNEHSTRGHPIYP